MAGGARLLADATRLGELAQVVLVRRMWPHRRYADEGVEIPFPQRVLQGTVQAALPVAEPRRRG